MTNQDVVQAGGAIPQVKGSESAFHRMMPKALALRAEEVQPFRGFEDVVQVNVQRMCAAVLQDLPALHKALPDVDFAALQEMPDLAAALVFVVGQAAVEVAPEVSVEDRRALEAQGWELRRLGLSSARNLALAKVVPAQDVAAIEEGRGKLDMARDNQQLHALFRKHWETAQGKHPVTAEQVEQMGEVGARLEKLLAPRQARERAAATPRDTLDLRDRLWTLLLQRHDVLWRVAAYRLGRDAVEEAVPSLLSREMTRKPTAT